MWFRRFTDWLRDLTENILSDQISRMLAIMLSGVLVVGLLSFWFYNRTHVFDSYAVRASAKEKDIEGTNYVMMGSHIIKYSPDGVFCVDTSNNTVWSNSYSMQTPVSDVAGDYMAIIEQQGKQVFVLKESGLVGKFNTELPILDVRIAKNGVVALVLKDSPATWINLYKADGTQLVSVKSTVEESGYPIALALSSNAKKMMVSYSGIKDGVLTGSVTFYDFSSSTAGEDSHVTGSQEYERELFPVLGYTDGDIPIAISDAGFTVFKKGSGVDVRTRKTFEKEIVSTFRDDENIGFIFKSDSDTEKYTMEIYNLSGHRIMEVSFDFDYTGVRMENGEILLYDTQRVYVYRANGKQKLNMKYKKEVRYFASIPGYRKYLVITPKSMDQIRLN